MALSPTSSRGGGTFNGGTITNQLTIHPPVDTNALTVRADAATVFADLLLLMNQTGFAVVEIDSSDDVTIDSTNQGGTINLRGGAGHFSVGSGNVEIGGNTGKTVALNADHLAFFSASGVTQPVAIANAAGGAIIDAEARAALNALLAAMRTLGLIAT